MKVVFIAHPIAGNVEQNLADIARIVKYINLNHPDTVPFVPYYADVVALNDADPQHRERGVRNAWALLKPCVVDELWLTGNRISDGMEQERQLAVSLGIPVRNYVGKI